MNLEIDIERSAGWEAIDSRDRELLDENRVTACFSGSLILTWFLARLSNRQTGSQMWGTRTKRCPAHLANIGRILDPAPEISPIGRQRGVLLALQANGLSSSACTGALESQLLSPCTYASSRKDQKWVLLDTGTVLGCPQVRAISRHVGRGILSIRSTCRL